MKREIPRIKLPEGYESMSDKELLNMIREGEKNPNSVKNRAKFMEELYKGTEQRVRVFHELLESEFFAVLKRFNLPLDKVFIASEGFLVEHNNSDPKNPSATITRHGKPVSRTLKVNDERIDSSCLAPALKDKLIKEGVLCEVLDDLQRMKRDATKTLQELLDAPEQPDHNCTEISVGPEDGKINRVVCLGKEYKA